MYKVLVHFRDLQDNSYEYTTGDTFPREGFEVSKERIEELASDKNRRGRALIVKEEIEMPTPVEAPEVIPEEAPEKPKRTRKRTKKSAD